MNINKTYFDKACEFIPGGVNSPVRSFKLVDRDPIFIKKSDGVFLTDLADNKYIDYICCWGAMIGGHNNKIVRKSVIEAVNNGLSYGLSTKIEVEIADTLCKLVPSLEQVRMVNSGTEATMSVIRLARAYTGRNLIIKFAGCYHGHSDSFLVQAGSGALTLGNPDSLGVPSEVASQTIIASFNDLDNVNQIFEKYRNKIAAVILEPVAGNMNLIPPVEGFLSGLKEICAQNNSLLIFDEVMTGFRVSKGGAQECYGVTPDLTTLGKIIGGGLPVGAFGGRKDIMQLLSPCGAVYQAGTLSGNPIAMAAGMANLSIIQGENFYVNLNNKTKRLVDGINLISSRIKKNKLFARNIGGMFGVFFSDKAEINNFRDISGCNADLFNKFFCGLLDKGVIFAPSPYEANFLSSEHSEKVIDDTLNKIEDVLTSI